MSFFIFLSACIAAGATGVIFPPGAWYLAQKRPSFTPPNWAFPVVWTALYLLMAWAAARLAAVPGSGEALALWSVQIALNTLWTPVFFGAHRRGAGMIVLGLLWLTVAALIVAAFRLDVVAGLILLPYLAWLSIAAALNYRIWRDNPGT